VTRRRRWTIRIALALAAAAAVLGVWTIEVEPDRLMVERVAIPLPGWPPALDGLTVAAVADLHAGSPHIDEEKIERLVDAVNALRPDVVVLLGDYVIQDVIGGHFIPPERTAALLSRLRGRVGVVAVLGNHDWWLDGRRVRVALESRGVPVLENEAVPLGAEGRRFWVAGIADAWTNRYDVPGTLARVPVDAPVLLLTHNPDLFPLVPPRVALTLAGHTHGGQVRLPLLGRPIVPSEYGQRYAAGLVREGGRTLFVSTGVGTSIIPVRFRVPPVISLLTLRAAPQGVR
jgi:predicted MPP superfamily phosphohydrolase